MSDDDETPTPRPHEDHESHEIEAIRALLNLHVVKIWRPDDRMIYLITKTPDTKGAWAVRISAVARGGGDGETKADLIIDTVSPSELERRLTHAIRIKEMRAFALANEIGCLKAIAGEE